MRAFSIRVVVGFFVLAALCLAIGCTSPHAAAPSIAPAPPPVGMRDFARALLLKPDGQPAPDAPRCMAPLLVQEVGGGAEPAVAPPIVPGRLRQRDTLGWRVDSSCPAIYWWSSLRRINNADHEQLTFFWFYPAEARLGAAAGVRWRWLRLTLDAEHFAAVVEALADDSAQVEIYISRSLEDAAVKQYGPPAAGASYAVIRSPARLSAHVVGTIEDGPTPMGPLVYLDAADQTVSSLTCRCTPSRVREIVDAPLYALVPAEELCAVGCCPEETRLALPAAATLPPWAFQAAAPDWLERVLRLPSDF